MNADMKKNYKFEGIWLRGKLKSLKKYDRYDELWHIWRSVTNMKKYLKTHLALWSGEVCTRGNKVC